MLEKLEINKLFFEQPKEEKKKKPRKQVECLGISFTILKWGIYQLIEKWLETLDCSDKEKNLYKEVNEKANRPSGEILSEEVLNKAREALAPAKEKIIRHLDKFVKHRQYVRKTFDFLAKIGAKFEANDAELQKIIEVHDLSKLTAHECLGYGFKWGQAPGETRPLTEEEENEWLTALDHHYSRNPHHAEYHYRKNESGEINAKGPIKETVERPKRIYQETVIDQTASTSDRVFSPLERFDLEEWLTTNEKYLKQFHDVDMEEVKLVYKEFREAIADFISGTGNNNEQDRINQLHGWFRDGQPVVWRHLISEKISDHTANRKDEKEKKTGDDDGKTMDSDELP